MLREVDRSGYNRRFECRCTKCGTVSVKWLSNLIQGKTTCLTCTPWSQINHTGREAIISSRRARAEVSEDGRICHSCGEWKPWARISPDSRRANGRGSNCVDCSYWRTIKSLYGITRAEWEWLLSSQNGQCKLCGELDTIRLNIDHDHACHPAGHACKKCIRGMLCRTCNRMLGHIESRPALRARFADYLDRRPLMSTVQSTAQPS